MNKLFKTPHKTLEISGVIAFILVMATQLWIRPWYGNQGDFLTFFLGVAPNFFGAIGLGLANFIYSRGKFTRNTKIILAGVGSIGALGIWEAIQTTTGKPIDNWDLFATMLGGLIAMTLIFFYFKHKESDLEIRNP